MESTTEHHKKQWYDKYYKIMLLPPVILLILSFIYLASFYSKNGDFIFKDSSLSGGTTITLNFDTNVQNLETALKQKFGDVSIRTITDISSGKHIALIIDSSAQPEDLKKEIESITGKKLTQDNSNIEFSGSSLGENFYKQLITAIIISFILMSIVIFALFRTFVPSVAVIFAAFADIVVSIAVVDFLGIKLSSAGIAAFLMLIGYSVDTDILLTTRVLKKKEGSVNQRIYGSFKTGIFMTFTGLAAVLPAFFIVTGLPDSFRQIFLILSIGLFADMINTWLTNASLIKWYADVKRIK